MCFYDYDNETLFTGDVADGRGTVRDSFVYITDVQGFYDSMEELSELNVGTLLLGHNYLPYQRAVLRGRRAKGLIAHTVAINDEIRKIILRLLKTYPQPLTAAEMSALIVPRIGPGYVLPSQEPNPTILAHLRALMEENRVEMTERAGSKLWRLR